MTEVGKITEFAKQKNVNMSIKRGILECGQYKSDQSIFVFTKRYGKSIFPLTKVAFDTREFKHRLEEKTLAESVILELSAKLADIKAREEFYEDMEYLKTLKEG